PGISSVIEPLAFSSCHLTGILLARARARSCRGRLAASLGGRSISLLAATPAFIFFSLLAQLITFLGREPLAGADLGSEKSRSGVVGRGSSQTGEGPDFVEHAHLRHRPHEGRHG